MMFELIFMVYLMREANSFQLTQLSLTLTIINMILTVIYYLSIRFNRQLKHFKTILFFLISISAILYCIESLNYPFTEYLFTDTHYFIVNILNLVFLIVSIYIYFKTLDKIIEMKKCIYCRREIPNSHNFCKYCGREQKEIPEKDIKISKDIQEEKEIAISPEEFNRLELKEDKITESREEKMEQLKELINKLHKEEEAEKQKGEAKENDTPKQSL